MKTVTLTTEHLVDELTKFEQTYSMPSAEFYDRYRAGELGDREEFMRWAGLCHMALRRGLLARTPLRA